MKIAEFQKELDKIVTYNKIEHDRRNGMYYISIYKFTVKNRITKTYYIGEKTLKDDKLAITKLKQIEDDYYTPVH